MSSKGNNLNAAARSRTATKKTATTTEDGDRQVKHGAYITSDQRDAIMITAARHRLSGSSLVAAIGLAAMNEDERLDDLLEDYAQDARKKRGGAH